MYQLSVALPAVEEKEKAEIIEMVKSFIKEINPLKIILFGSFATGEYNTASDYDFYIVVEDNFEGQQITLAAKAHKSIRRLKTRPVDIIVETVSRFNSFADKASCIEHEVSRSGVILCERMFLVMDEISTPLTEQEDHPLLHDQNIKEFLERIFEEYDLKRKE